MERSICESVVQNDGSSGPEQWRSELAAVVRAATEGLGEQSILSDFDLCGLVAIKSDATAAIWDGSSTGIRKSSTFGCGRDFWVQRHVRSWKIQVSNMSGLENLSNAQSTLGQNHYCTIRKRVIEYLSMDGCD